MKSNLMSQRAPDLLFGPAGTNEGFTPAGIASFDDLRSATVIRELIQNALDAARTANSLPAQVHFQITRMPKSEIPGIMSYEKAFEKAEKMQRSLSKNSLALQAGNVVQRIRTALECDEVDVLTIIDNGIGLNEDRMNALLSDGLSMKDGSATGTYGNGHSTTIPTSDLRYIFYVGVTSDSESICSGHAVLASHHQKGKKYLQSAHGFFICDFHNSKRKLYDYLKQPENFNFFSGPIAQIKSKTPVRIGTAVIIPAFNHFREKKNLWEIVSQVTAANFFVAIEKKQLEVTVEDLRKGKKFEPRTLNNITLTSTLFEHQGEQRAFAFLNGRRAYEIHQAYCLGKRHLIKTSAGQIEIRLRASESNSTRVDLCRNGMWVTDRIPGLINKFTSQVPFQAVLCLEAEEGGRLHELIRLAEGPLHEKIVLKNLQKSDRTMLRKSLKEIKEWILNNTTTINTTTYLPDDFLTINFGGNESVSRGHTGKSKNDYWGVPKINSSNIQRNTPSIPSIEPNKPRNRTNNSRKSLHKPRSKSPRPDLLPDIFQAAACPAGNNRQRIVIKCISDIPNAELRLAVDEALDATCERHSKDAYTPVAISNIKLLINGIATEQPELSRMNGEAIGVFLGNLKKDDYVDVETNYRLLGDFENLPNPSLRIEICKSETSESASSENNSSVDSEL